MLSDAQDVGLLVTASSSSATWGTLLDLSEWRRPSPSVSVPECPHRKENDTPVKINGLPGLVQCGADPPPRHLPFHGRKRKQHNETTERALRTGWGGVGCLGTGVQGWQLTARPSKCNGDMSCLRMK